MYSIKKPANQRQSWTHKLLIRESEGFGKMYDPDFPFLKQVMLNWLPNCVVCREKKKEIC